MRWGNAFKGSTHTSSERKLAHVQPHRSSIAARAAWPCSTWETRRGGPCARRGICRGRACTHAAKPAVMESGLPASSALQSTSRDRCCSLASGERSALCRSKGLCGGQGGAAQRSASPVKSLQKCSAAAGVLFKAAWCTAPVRSMLYTLRDTVLSTGYKS